VQNSISLISQQLPTICHHKNLKIQIVEMHKEKLNIKIIKCPEHGDLFPQNIFKFDY